MATSTAPQHEYSHARTVNAITDYYRFLERLFLPPGLVLYPPSGGWPTITPRGMSDLGKNDTVIELIKHIPYFDPVIGQGGGYCILRETWPIQYNSESVLRTAARESQKRSLEREIYMKAPSHVICLANGGRYAYHVLIDTERGVVVWGCADGRVAGPPSNQGFDLIPDGISNWGPGTADAWMDNSTYGVEEIFTLWKEMFITMQWMPDPVPHPYTPEDIREVDHRYPPSSADLMIRQVMVDAGWPGDKWDREGAERGWQELSVRLEEISTLVASQES